MTGEELKNALVALFGGHGWQTRAAQALGTDTSSIRRWTGGQIPVPGPVAAAVTWRAELEARKNTVFTEVIFDMDGTLADVEHRRPFVTGPEPNWPAWNDRMGDDPPNAPIVALARMFHEAFPTPPTTRGSRTSSPRSMPRRSAARTSASPPARPWGSE